MFPEVKNFLLCIETGVNSYQEDQGSDLSLCAPVRLGHGKCYYIFLAFLRYRINFSASKKNGLEETKMILKNCFYRAEKKMAFLKKNRNTIPLDLRKKGLREEVFPSFYKASLDF